MLPAEADGSLTPQRAPRRAVHDRAACVDVIIPAYRGLAQTRACIESVLASSVRTAAEIIVINDASPEPELTQYLRGLGSVVTLLENEANLGFVATVNRGMTLHPERDVVLLNSDTVVANDWLDRLRECAWREAATASVTPFSNNATICSYPCFCADNALPQGMSVAELDALFRDVNRGAALPIPTAVGFCMYIRRDCLEQVGLFDVALFGRGYGEENEFCLRAARHGWQHLLCADVFVYHAGGVSFADTQSEQKNAAMKTLTALYPDYESLIQRFVAADPPAPYRRAVDVARQRRDAGEGEFFPRAQRNLATAAGPDALAGEADGEGDDRYDARRQARVLSALGSLLPQQWKIRLKHWLQQRDG
jgi:GT2 family glycosyltransferase